MVAEKPLPPVGVINQVRLTAPGNPVLVPPVAASVGTVFVSLKLIDVGRVPAAVKLSSVLGLPKMMLVAFGNCGPPFVRVKLPTTSAPPLMMPANGIVTVNELVVVRSLVSVKVPLTVMLLPSVTLPPVLLMVRLLKAVVFVKVCAPVPSKTTVLLTISRPSPGGAGGLAPSPLATGFMNVPPLLSEPVSESVRPLMFSVPPLLMVSESICKLLLRVTFAPLSTVVWLVGVILPVKPALLIACVPAPNDSPPPLIVPSRVRSLPLLPLMVSVLPLMVSVRPLARFKLFTVMSVVPMVG